MLFRRIPLLLSRSVCRLRRILRGRAFGLSGFFLVALILVSAGQASAALGFAMRKRVLGVCWRGRGAGAGRLFFLRSFSRHHGGWLCRLGEREAGERKHYASNCCFDGTRRHSNSFADSRRFVAILMPPSVASLLEQADAALTLF